MSKTPSLKSIFINPQFSLFPYTTLFRSSSIYLGWAYHSCFNYHLSSSSTYNGKRRHRNSNRPLPTVTQHKSHMTVPTMAFYDHTSSQLITLITRHNPT